jgi:hypothetical protein
VKKDIGETAKSLGARIQEHMRGKSSVIHEHMQEARPAISRNPDKSIEPVSQ